MGQSGAKQVPTSEYLRVVYKETADLPCFDHMASGLLHPYILVNSGRVCYGETVGKSNLWNEGFTLAHGLGVQPLMSQKVQQEERTSDLVTPAVRNQAAMSTTGLSFSPLFILNPQPRLRYHPHSR